MSRTAVMCGDLSQINELFIKIHQKLMALTLDLTASDLRGILPLASVFIMAIQYLMAVSRGQGSLRYIYEISPF